MRAVYIILFAFILSGYTFGQTLDNDSLSLNINKKRLESTRLNQYPRLSDRNIFDDETPAKSVYQLNASERVNKLDSLKIKMNVYVPEFYQGPVYNYLSDSKFPFANDYRYSGYWSVSDRSGLTTRSTHETYPGLGSSTQIGAVYSYMLSDNIIISGGPYAAKYMVNHTIYNDMGVNAALKFNISDRVGFRIFGQYSGFANKHGFNSENRWGMFPQSSFGGAFEYKITDKFGVMGGMNRELNPMTGKWRNVPFLVPVFYGK